MTMNRIPIVLAAFALVAGSSAVSHRSSGQMNVMRCHCGARRR